MALVGVVLQALPTTAATLAVGDWVVADPDAQAVVRVDALGQTEVITSGAQLVYPTGVAFDPAEAVAWVVDPDARRLVRVNPISGSQEIVYEGAPFVYPTGVALAANGTDLLVMDPDARLVWRVDPLLPTVAAEIPLTSIPYRTDLVEMSNSRYGVCDPDANAVFDVDPNSTATSPITQDGELGAPRGITEESVSGDLLVADGDRPGFVRVEPASGTTALEANGLGLQFPTGITYVPEPARGLQLVLGALGLLVLRRRPRAVGGARPFDRRP